ncbi:MAG: efflux RND transporter permease subunit [Clostridia bacterium]|nr:efflux RND transporter permease subunit [Clostridia bacterium]
MNITRFSVQRPAATIMLLILVLGLGVLGFTSLGANLFPSVDVPVVVITTVYRGAGAEEIEKQVVKPIEDALSSISGIDTIRSNSGEGFGFTLVRFTLSTNMNTAVLDVQKSLDAITGDLPKDADKPIIQKIDNGAEPIMLVTLSGEVSEDEIFSQAENLKKDLQRLEGVGNISLEGSKKKEVTIELDKNAMELYGISIGTVLGRLQSENMNMPAGDIKQENEKQAVRLKGEFDNTKDFENLRIPLALPGKWIRLSDLGTVKYDYPEDKKLVRVVAKPAVGLYVQKQSDANIVEVGEHVKKELEKLKQKFPKAVKLEIVSDSTEFIISSIEEIQRDIVLGIIITAVIMFLFLRKVKTSLIVLVSIPASLAATFFMMYVLGFTMNILTLLALSICIGILVDDSIVVLENIERHLKMGKNPLIAAVEARSEIGMAAIAITLCDVVVFTPIAFMSGLVGRFFKEFGLTVACATLFSLVVSFTLTPMLASRLLKSENASGSEHAEDHETGFFGKIIQYYSRILIWALNNRLKVIGLVLALIVLSISLIPLRVIGTEFLPASDQGKLIVDITLGTGAKLSQTDEKVKAVEKHLRELPEVKDFYAISGYDNRENRGYISINLVDKGKRKKSQDRMANELREFVREIPGIQGFIIQPSIAPSDGRKPIDLRVKGSNRDIVKALSKKVEEIVKSVPGTTDVENSAATVKKEISIKINRLEAASFGVLTSDISMALRASVGGAKAGVFRKNGDEFDVMVKYTGDQVNTSDKIGGIKVPAANGNLVSLSQIATIELTSSTQETERIDRQAAVSVMANLQGRPLGDVTSDIDAKLKNLEMPIGYEIKKGGEQSNMSESFSSLVMVLVASLALIYMILVLLYESFLTPVIRLLSPPLGIIGGLVGLAITRNSLNLTSMIGIIMLDALVAKGSTLLIDYTNTLMKQGLNLKEALIKAGTTRLRPILMTSMAMISGMFPAALAMGDGAEVKAGMAVVLVGGLISSTLLSPVVIPVAYTLIEDFRTVWFKQLRTKVVKIFKGKEKEEVGTYEVEI